MCLIFVAANSHPKYKLVIGANRDECIERPTSFLDFWEDHPHICAGRDLERGGTWFGVSRSGRIGGLTNFLESTFSCDAPARGQLLSKFLTESCGPRAYEYCHQIADPHRYNGFNMLLANVLPESDRVHLSYFGNRDPLRRPVDLTAGIYGLGNRHLDTPWLKVQRGKHLLSEALYHHKEDLAPEHIFEIMQDRKRFPEHRPGVWEAEFEANLSSIFCWHKPRNYGTRSSCVVLVDLDNKLTVCERSYGLDSKGDLSPEVIVEQRRQSFDIEFPTADEMASTSRQMSAAQQEEATMQTQKTGKVPWRSLEC